MRESLVQTEFKHLVDSEGVKFPRGAYELKLVKGQTFNLKNVAPHQLYYLKKVKDTFYFKIPDSGFSQKPFDCFVMSGNAYVVPIFYIARKKKVGYAMPIALIESLVERSEFSLKEEVCYRYADYILDLKRGRVYETSLLSDPDRSSIQRLLDLRDKYLPPIQ